MRKSIIIVAVVLLTLVLATAVSAQVPAPGGPFQTSFNVQNLSTSANASCSIIFYDSNGTSSLTVTPDPIGPGAKAEYYTGNSPVNSLNAGQYSAVVSCDQPVAAVVNYSDSDSGASHNGLTDSEVGMTFSAPVIYNNYFGFYTNVVVQNATSSNNDIKLEILEAGGNVVYTDTKSNVAGYASVNFSQSGLSQLNPNVSYAARISGTGNIASVVNIYGTGSFDGQLYSYNPFASGSQTAYAPVIMNNYYGYSSSLTVQNTSSADTATVKVTYSNGNTETQDIGPGSGFAFVNKDDDAVLPAGNVLYSATIESFVQGTSSGTPNGPAIVATVNQSNDLNRAATYNAVASGSQTVRAPVVYRSFYGFDSSVTCQNVGSGPTDIDITYSTGQTSKIGTAVPAGETRDIVQLFDASLDGVPVNYTASATITASQDIVCVVNQNIIAGSGATESKDQFYSYNGIK